MEGIQLSNHLPFLCCGMGIIIKALTLHTSEKRVGGESALSTADVVITNGQGRRTGLSSHCVKAGAMYGEGDTPQAHHLATCYLIFFFEPYPMVLEAYSRLYIQGSSLVGSVNYQTGDQTRVDHVRGNPPTTLLSFGLLICYF